MDQARFDRKIEGILAVQASHDSQIKGLIRAAQLQQASLKRLEARQSASMAKTEKEYAETRREHKRLDARLDKLVSAIGEFISRTPARN